MNTSSLFNRLMEINHEVFEEQHFNVAYHALAVALYCAKDENNQQSCAQVEGIAATQAEWIDLHAPHYEHSSQASRNRGIT